MSKRILLAKAAAFAVASVLGISTAARADDAPAAGQPGKAITIGATASATVKAIDREKRIVTLQKEDGEEVEVKCGKQVQNFDQIKVGDEVKAAAFARLVVALDKDGGQSEAASGAAIVRSPKGSRPGALIVKTERVSAKVDAVDAAAQTVTLSGLGDEPKTIQVASDVDLSKVSAGDTVMVKLTKGVALWVATPGGAEPAAQLIKPGEEGFAIEKATGMAEVTAVDAEKRTVTLKTPEGKTRTINLGKECVNFDQIKVGDKVRATVAEAVAISARKAGEAQPSEEARRVVGLASKGDKRGMLVADTEDVTAQIKSIDTEKRAITLTEADGDTRTVKAGPNLDLSALTAGDQVTLRITQAAAIVVEKP